MSPRMVNWLSRLAALMDVRKAFVAGVIAFLFLAGLILFLCRDKEPSYERHTASDWLELVSTNQQKMPDAVRAFRAMGPRGIEFLGDRLLRKTNSIDTWLLAHHQQIPSPFKKILLKPQNRSNDETILKLLSYSGTNAALVIPNLITWLERQSTTAYVPYTNPLSVKSSSFTKVPRSVITISNGIRITNLAFLYPTQRGTTVANQFISRTPPNLITQIQVVVTSPGNVTTNTNVLIRVASAPIPKLAFQMLTNFGSEDARVIPLLLNKVVGVTLHSPPPLGPNLSRAARRAVPLLVQNAQSYGPNSERRFMALSLLSLTLPQSRAARETLTRALMDPKQAVFDTTITALQNITNDLDIIVPLATQSLLRFRNRTTDLDGDWQPPVYLALEKFSAHSPLVIPLLQETLPQADFYERIGILQLLRKVGTSNTVNLDLVETFTKNQHPTIRAAAWFALGKLKNDRVAEATGHITRLATGDEQTIKEACQTLGDLGPASKAAVPELVRHLHLSDENKVQMVVETLGKIGPAAKDALESLYLLHSHPAPAIRVAAEEAIGKIYTGPK